MSSVLPDFQLSFAHFLTLNPLWNYRIEKNRQNTVSVLLLGKGTNIKTMCTMLLQAGQYLNATLEITIVSSDSRRTLRDNYMKKMPALAEYTKLMVDGRMYDDSQPKRVYAVLNFEKGNADTYIPDTSDFSCILISTDDDERNVQTARRLSQLSFERPVLVGCVQNTGELREPTKSDNMTLAFFGKADRNLNEFAARLDREAFMTHYLYEVSRNSRQDMQTIAKDFIDSYNRNSSLNSALHQYSRLWSCGINPTDAVQAAAEYAALLRKRPELLDGLAALEHQRWMMDYICQGYRGVREDELNQIFQMDSPDIQTKNKTERWHCCLVPYDVTKPRMNWEHWLSDDRRSELDELDEMSLRLRDKARELAKYHQKSVINAFERMRQDTEAALPAAEFHTLTDTLNQLEIVLSQMMNDGRRVSSFLFERLLSRIEKTLNECGERYQEIALKSVTHLRNMTAPQRYALKQIDYKEYDYYLTVNLPLILTGGNSQNKVLVKCLSGDGLDSVGGIDMVASLLRLSPERVELAAVVCNSFEMKQFEQTAENLSQFFRIRGIAPEINKVAFCSRSIDAETDATIIYLNDESAGTLCKGVGEWMDDLSYELDEEQELYADVTNCDADMTFAMQSTAAKLFYMRNGKIYDLRDSKEIEYYNTIPNEITISEMFSISGAKEQSIESESVSKLSQSYQEFWNVAVRNMKALTELNNLKTQYPSQKSVSLCTGDNEDLQDITVPIKNSTAEKLYPALAAAYNDGKLKNLGIERKNSIFSELCFSVQSDIKQAQTIQQAIKQMDEAHNDYSLYRYSFNHDTKDMELGQYSMRRTLYVGPDKKEKEKYISQDAYNLLKKLCEMGYLCELEKTDDTHVSFVVLDERVWDCLNKRGSVLENYLYYSMLDSGFFDDITMGWKFQHSREKTFVKNELDIIATKGLNSLFISAKLNADDDKYRYSIYELKVLASQFGGPNAKMVMAVSGKKMFDDNGDLSNDFWYAIGRGTYLVGKEAMKNADILARTLNGIAEGEEDWWKWAQADSKARKSLKKKEKPVVLECEGLKAGMVVPLNDVERIPNGVRGIIEDSTHRATLSDAKIRKAGHFKKDFIGRRILVKLEQVNTNKNVQDKWTAWIADFERFEE